MTAIKRGYRIASLRFKKIRGNSFYDYRTHRFVSRKRALRLTYKILYNLRQKEIIKRIKKAHPDWTNKQIRDKIKKANEQGKKWRRDWFGKYK